MLNLDGLSATEQRILTAALDCFVDRGYFNTAIPHIVRAAGVSTGSIYHHFCDKQRLAQVLLDRLIAGIDAQFQALTDRQDSPMQTIASLIRWMLQQADEQPGLISFILYARHREFLPEEPPICTRSPFEHMRALVVEAQRQGQLPQQVDPLVMSAQVFGPTLRLVQAAVDGVLPQPARHYEDELIRLLEAMRPGSPTPDNHTEETAS